MTAPLSIRPGQVWVSRAGSRAKARRVLHTDEQYIRSVVNDWSETYSTHWTPRHFRAWITTHGATVQP